MYQILKKQTLNANTKLMVIEAPHVARKAEPGQFIILRVSAEGERIPLTIADFDREKGSVTIIFQEVGATTMALGASRAIKQAGRDGDGIIVCGFDGISSGVQAVVDGEISCTVAQDPYNMGYQCVKSLLDVVEGEKLDDFIDTGCKVITTDNAQEYLDKLKSLV